MADQGLVLVVNFEQEREIGSFLVDLRRFYPLEDCLVVDDGSRDGSAEIAESQGYRVIRHERNLGVGAAIRTGLDEAKRMGREFVLITASNGKMQPSEFSRLMAPVRDGSADYVQGSRYLEAGASPGLPVFRRVMIPAFTLFASLLMRRKFTDITCGLRCYRLAVLDLPGIDLRQEWLDRYELEYYLHYRVARTPGIRILEVPVTMRYDQLSAGRSSKIIPIIGWWSMIRPFLFLALRLRK